MTAALRRLVGRLRGRDDRVLRCDRHLADGTQCDWRIAGDNEHVRQVRYWSHLQREHSEG